MQFPRHLHLLAAHYIINYLIGTSNHGFFFPTRHLHLLAVHHIINYLIGISSHGFFFPTGASTHLQACSVSNWVGCPDTRKSSTSWCMFLKEAPISWKCKKQDPVSKSSTEAEYRAMSATCSEIIWMRGLLLKLGFSKAKLTHCMLTIQVSFKLPQIPLTMKEQSA